MTRRFRSARRLFSPKRLLVRWNLQLDAVQENCVVRNWHQLSSLDRMIVVLEDKRFLRHRGIDWLSISRISYQTIWGKRRGGASTIEMQLIRTILDKRERTVSRKLNEFVLAWLLNFRIDKISILYSYRSLAFFGSHLEGADIAAEQMFMKKPEELSLDQAAFLAAMLVYPRPNQETENWRRRVTRRADYGLSIYRRLEERGDQITKR